MRYILFTICIIFLYLSQKYENKRKLFLILSVVSLLIFSTFRQYIDGGAYAGVDYYSYMSWFNSIEHIKISITNDILFNLLMLGVYKSTGSFLVFIFITAAFGIFAIYKFALDNYKNDYAFVIFLFITFGLHELGLNAVRQFMAISVFLLVFKYIGQKNFWKYFIGIVIATLFHSSAVLLIFVYPFINIKLSIKKKAIMFVVLAIGATILINSGIYEELLIKYVPNYIYKYANIGSELNSNYTVFIISATIMIGMQLFKEVKEKVVKYDNSSCMYLLLLCFFAYIATLHATLGRMLQYFMPAVTLSLPITLDLINDKKLAKLGRICVCILFLLIYIL